MLKKLKSLFILEDENDNEKKTSAEESKPATSSSKSTSIPSIEVDFGKPKKLSGAPDSKFVDVLLKAVESNNLDGFDYLEYKSSLQSLTKMDMDEATKYQSAFAMAKTMGATPAKLLESAKHYIQVLVTEETKFKDALQNQRAKQVTGRESQIKDLESQIVSKQNRIEQLKKEIEADKSNLEKIKSEINQSAAKVETTNDKFMHAYNTVRNQILKDVENMKTYLK